MTVLSIRTDKPEAEVGLYKDGEQFAYETWPAHRALAETIHEKINEILSSYSLAFSDVEGIVCYKGPGSFTGLRIGLSVANALAYSLNIPIIGIEGEQDWLEKGLDYINNGQKDSIVIPAYGAPVHITTPKK